MTVTTVAEPKTEAESTDSPTAPEAEGESKFVETSSRPETAGPDTAAEDTVTESRDPEAESAPSADADPDKEKKPAKSRRRKHRDVKELTEYKRVVEGLLFSSKEPVGASRLASVIGDLTTQEVKTLVEAIGKDFRRQKRGVMIEEIAGGYRVVTVPDLSDAVKKLHRIRTEDRLSPAALETLAIVAYRQPVIRADIEVIRGVACGGTLKWLMEKGLVKIQGRAEVLGRPLLYGTTRQFLEQFGIPSIKDLPRVDEFRANS